MVSVALLYRVPLTGTSQAKKCATHNSVTSCLKVGFTEHGPSTRQEVIVHRLESF